MIDNRTLQYRVERLTRQHDASTFASGMEAIDNYIKHSAKQDMKRSTTVVFVALDLHENIVRGYYSLSGATVVLSELPSHIQNKLPRYPNVPATLLGRLGVDRNYRLKIGPEAKLGEFLLMDAQKRALESAQTTIGSAFFIIDVLTPSEADLANGAKDPLPFYLHYGFLQFDSYPRKLYKPMKTIQQEFDLAVDS